MNKIKLISSLNYGQIEDKNLKNEMNKLNLNNLEDVLLYLYNNIIVEVPCPCLNTTEIIYDNTEKSIPLVNENGEPYLFDDLVEITGTTKATNAGIYSVTISLKNPYNSMWKEYENAEVADNIAAPAIPENKKDSITIEWEIKKADIITTVDKTNVTFDLNNLTETITLFNFNWDIENYIEFTTTDEGLFRFDGSDGEADISNPTVSLTINSTYKKGNAIFSMKWTGMENYNDKEIIINIDASNMPDPVLNNNTPEIIQKTAKAGLASNYWNIGDRVGIYLNGTVGDLQINGNYYAFILGFNHNSSYEGSNTIHFRFGKYPASNSKDFAFTDSKYNNTGNDAAFRMNTTNTNTGGWSESYMRSTICPAFKSAITGAWRNIIAACTKFTDNTGGGSDTASYVKSTNDYIFLLSEFEVFGNRYYANSAEQNYQQQYDYYQNGNSRVNYKHNDATTACYWWLRSPHATHTTSFCVVSAGGGYGSASYSLGFAPAFIVA